MAEWFQTKVKFLQQGENGLIKKMNETYLVDAMSFTEAESRVLQEVAEGMKELTMVSVSRTTIAEVVFFGDTEKWFKVKVVYVTMDPDTEREKKVTTYLMINAENLKEAYERTEDHLKEMLVPFSIPKIEESPIIEVFQHIPGVKASMKQLVRDEEE